jgi:hypothetical protein
MMRTTTTNITTRGRRWQKTITTSNCTTYHKTKSSSRSKSRSWRRSISNGRSSKRTYVYSIGFYEFALLFVRFSEREEEEEEEEEERADISCRCFVLKEEEETNGDH